MNKKTLENDVKKFIEEYCVIDCSGREGFFFPADELTRLFRIKSKYQGVGERLIYSLILKTNDCLLKQIKRVPVEKNGVKELKQKTCIVNLMYKDSIDSFKKFKKTKLNSVLIQLDNTEKEIIKKKHIKIKTYYIQKILKKSQKEKISFNELLSNILNSSL